MPLDPPSRARRNRTLLLAASVVVLAVLLAWWAWPRADVVADDAGGRKPTPVRIARASAEPLQLRLKAIGTVTPLHSVVVRSRVDGELLKLHFNEGQHVNAGDLLARAWIRASR